MIDRRDYFKKKKWTREQEDWLIEHKMIRGKKAMHEAFFTAFPDATYTDSAISSKRTELGAYSGIYTRHRTAKPLYSECVKQGYVMIKVAKYEWWQKQKWVWVATHPGEPFSIKNQFVFLDGDNRNFSPDNIHKVDHRIIGVMNMQYGGTIKGEPELNLIRYLQCELKLKYLDAAEKHGLTAKTKSGRQLISERNRKAREQRAAHWARISEEEREIIRQKRKEYWKKRRMNPEFKERNRNYQREWSRKRREKMRNERKERQEDS